MKKIIEGFVAFRNNLDKNQKENFRALAKGQEPEILLITCADSRVVPNLILSMPPGQLFTLRNLGNIVPPFSEVNEEIYQGSEIAAIEFSLRVLKIKNIVICGHSQCGAMEAILSKTNQPDPQKRNINQWLKNSVAVNNQTSCGESGSALSEADQLSRANVLQQMEHLLTYNFVQEQVNSQELNIHGWWFDIATAQIFNYSSTSKAFEEL